MEQLFDKTLEVCQRLNNGRTLQSTLDHLQSEVNELTAEVFLHINDHRPGPDGVEGECVDVILCAIDLMYQKNPAISKAYILSIVNTKLEKWEKLYADSPIKPESPTMKRVNPDSV